MKNILVFEFHSGKKIIGEYIGDLPPIDTGLPDVFILKNARVIIGQQVSQGAFNIAFAPPWKAPASIGIPWPGNLLPYRGEDIETRYPPDQNILSSYMKDASGFLLPIGGVPKEMRQ